MTTYTLQPVNPASPVQESIQQLVRAGQGPCVIVNRDLGNSITVAHSIGTQIPDLLNLDNNQISMIDPLGSVTVTGEDDVWGINLNSSAVAVDVHPQSIATQVSPTLIAEQLQLFGIPPGVPNVDTHHRILEGPGSWSLFTLTATSRIWGATVSASIGSSGGTGTNHMYAQVLAGSDTLVIVECCVVGNPMADSNTASLTFSGIEYPAGTVLSLDVNNGATITGTVQRGSGVIIISTP